jgi:hypothetical protein
LAEEGISAGQRIRVLGGWGEDGEGMYFDILLNHMAVSVIFPLIECF